MMEKIKQEMTMKCIADRAWRVPNDLGEMARTANEVGKWLEGFPLPSRIPYSARLIVEEMGSNVVKYAYGDDQPHVVRVQVYLSREGVQISLEDDGKPFDPFERPLPDVEGLMGEEGEGGLGLALVRKVCRSVGYERRDGKNRVSLELAPWQPDDTQPLPDLEEFLNGSSGIKDRGPNAESEGKAAGNDRKGKKE